MARLKDVAEKAGVSIVTVSRALKDDAAIRPDTKLRILKIVKELNYEPLVSPNRLSGRKTNLIGLIVHDVSNPFFAQIVKGVEDIAHSKNLSLILCNSYDNIYKETEYLKRLMQKKVDGLLIFASAGHKSYLKQMTGMRNRIVLIDCSIDDFDFVKTDNEKGSYLATEHLISTGHTRIAYICGRLEGSWRTERLEGYRRALSDHSIPFDESLILQGSVSKQHGFEATGELLRHSRPPTAILAQNDLVAIGVLEALEAVNKAVPADIAVVGYDDVNLSTIAKPQLTSVVQPKYELGQIAADILTRKISNPERDSEPTRIILQPRLVVRESSVPLVKG